MLQNLAWAAGYNIVAIPLAAGALAWAGITLSPAVGAVLMSVSTIVVALNAQLLRRVQLRPDTIESASDRRRVQRHRANLNRWRRRRVAKLHCRQVTLGAFAWEPLPSVPDAAANYMPSMPISNVLLPT